MKTPRLCRLLFIFFLTLSVSPAHANKETAKQLFLEGQRLYDLAEFQHALESFKKAYLAYEEPSFLFNIAQCYRQLGNKPEALRFYKTYLRKVPEAPNADEVRRRIASLETSLAQDKAAATAPPSSAPPPEKSLTGAPAPTVEPRPAPAPEAPAAMATLTRTPEVTTRKPVYQKWWFWVGVVGGAAVAATAIAVGVTEGRPTEPSFVVHY
jgi:tetratricopeptide (TPR) repeat protein